jgi:Glycogen recognition site of AMP-activated protein kinase
VSEHEIDPFIEEIAGELRRPVRFDSTFESRVMAELESSIGPLSVNRKASTPWLLRPRTFYVSPLAGLAVAAGLVAIITMSVLRTAPDARLAAGSNPDTSIVPPSTPVVRQVANTAAPVPVSAPFTYIDRRAKSVAVVGSFNDWEPIALTQTSDSVWSGSAMLLPGRYEYQLVVDGRWIADPAAQRTAASDFGGANSVLIVSPVPR